MAVNSRQRELLATIGIVGLAAVVLWYLKHQPAGQVSQSSSDNPYPTITPGSFTSPTYQPGSINITPVTNPGIDVSGSQPGAGGTSTTYDGPSRYQNPGVPALTTFSFLPTSPFVYTPTAPVPLFVNPLNDTTSSTTSPVLPSILGIPNYGGGVSTFTPAPLPGVSGATGEGSCSCNSGSNPLYFGSAQAQADYMSAQQPSNINVAVQSPGQPLQQLNKIVTDGLNGVANFVINVLTPAPPATSVVPIIVSNGPARTVPSVPAPKPDVTLGANPFSQFGLQAT